MTSKARVDEQTDHNAESGACVPRFTRPRMRAQDVRFCAAASRVHVIAAEGRASPRGRALVRRVPSAPVTPPTVAGLTELPGAAQFPVNGITRRHALARASGGVAAGVGVAAFGSAQADGRPAGSGAGNQADDARHRAGTLLWRFHGASDSDLGSLVAEDGMVYACGDVAGYGNCDTYGPAAAQFGVQMWWMARTGRLDSSQTDPHLIRLLSTKGSVCPFSQCPSVLASHGSAILPPGSIPYRRSRADSSVRPALASISAAFSPLVGSLASAAR